MRAGLTSHPTRVRGLKLRLLVIKIGMMKSHPTRVRGLKLGMNAQKWKLIKSHPTRVRGLKLQGHGPQSVRFLVAPHAGAWIETDFFQNLFRVGLRSHPTQVRGLKLIEISKENVPQGSHPTRVRGLKPTMRMKRRG